MPILTAILAGTLAAAPAPASPPMSAYGPVTAAHRIGSDRFCIRSGWGYATTATSRTVRRGDCRTSTEWRHRGILFTPVQRAD